MFTVLLSILICLWCFYKLIDLNGFIADLDDDGKLALIDALFIVVILIWLIAQFFFISGPIVVVLFFSVIFYNSYYNRSISHKKKILLLRVNLYVIIFLTLFIAINKIHLNINFWQKLFI